MSSDLIGTDSLWHISKPLSSLFYRSSWNVLYKNLVSRSVDSEAILL